MSFSTANISGAFWKSWFVFLDSLNFLGLMVVSGTSLKKQVSNHHSSVSSKLTYSLVVWAYRQTIDYRSMSFWGINDYEALQWVSRKVSTCSSKHRLVCITVPFKFYILLRRQCSSNIIKCANLHHVFAHCLSDWTDQKLGSAQYMLRLHHGINLLGCRTQFFSNVKISGKFLLHRVHFMQYFTLSPKYWASPCIVEIYTTNSTGRFSLATTLLCISSNYSSFEPICLTNLHKNASAIYYSNCGTR